MDKRGPEETYALFMNRKFINNKRWLFYVFELLPAKTINRKKLKRLFRLYRTAERADLPQTLDFLLKYHDLTKKVVPKVVTILAKKVKVDSAFAYPLIDLFNPHKEVARMLPELFSKDTSILKRAYYLAEHYAGLSDHKGEFFAVVIGLDREFIVEYIGWKHKDVDKGWLSSRDIGRDYSFVWELPDYQKMINMVVNYVYELESSSYPPFDPILGAFFGCEEKERKTQVEIIEKQDDLLLQLIDQRAQEVDFIRYLFRLISCFSAERRVQFIDRFVNLNDDPEVFGRLSLEPSSWSWSGSQVSLLQDRLDYWESLLPVMNSVKLLEHRRRVEQQIQQLEKEIEREKKSDFIDDRP
jgi:hypothetical protein